MRSCQCAHLQSVDYRRSDAGNVVLDEDVLKEMVQHKWFSEERKRQCLNSQKKAEEQDRCFASYVNLGGPSYMHYVSVFEPNVSFYNRLGRIMVVYNAKLNTWHCPCTRPRRSCIHKAVCKRHLFQTNRKLFQRVKSTEEDLTCKNSLPVDTCLSLEKDHDENTVYPPTNEDLKKMVQYIFTNKTIQSSLPISTTDLNEKEFPKVLVPNEMHCSSCLEHAPLSDPLLISNKAKIVTTVGIIEGRYLLVVNSYFNKVFRINCIFFVYLFLGVETYCKTCPVCGLAYRYQEWSTGVHNYDDHIILGLKFCLLLRSFLQVLWIAFFIPEAFKLSPGGPVSCRL